MTHNTKPIYLPSLRMKAGELQGLKALSNDVANCIWPRIIVPPRKERDATQGALFSTDDIPGVGPMLASHWYGRPAILDPTFLFDDFGEIESSRWLPAMFESARRENVPAIPVATLDDLIGDRLLAFKHSIDTDLTPSLALRIESGDMVDAELKNRVYAAIKGASVSPENCVLIADFSDATFDNVEIVADIIDGALQLLQEIGRWHVIAFQGTNFPSTNPAAPGSNGVVDRNEWLAWRRACGFDRSTANHLVFGDFAADCAQFKFGGSGGRAIRHYRYTIKDEWLVVRGNASGKDTDVMRDVCERILSSGHFAGRTFSLADEYIYKTAKGLAGPGNSTTWRQVNTTHHITRLVRDIGKVRGLLFTERAEPVELEQGLLF